MNQPYLLNIAAHQSLARGDAHARQSLRLQFLLVLGELAEYWSPHLATQLLALDGKLCAGDHKQLHREWSDAVAREILLLENPAAELENLPCFGDARPLGESGPTLAELSKHRLAAALYPLDADQPAVGQVWVVSKSAGIERPANKMQDLTAQYSLLPNTICFHLNNLKADHPVVGASWTLAAGIADLALEASQSDRLNLARTWMITGELSAYGVRAIRIGSKPVLENFCQHRRWMIPTENLEQKADSAGVLSRAYSGRTLQGIWNTIGGRSIEQGHERQWPSSVSEAHALVSAARYPVILFALLLRPKRLTLWHSADELISYKPARELHELLGTLCPDMQVTLQKPAIDSEDMATCFLQFQAGLRSSIVGQVLTPISVTNCTWLIRAAAFHLASLEPSLQMLYLDPKPEKLDHHFFTSVRLVAGQPFTNRLPYNAQDPVFSQLNWEVLHSQDDKKNGVQELLSKINPTGITIPITA